MKKFYITTSIAYTNAPPHIGFALESIQADVIARHRRFLGEEVFFLTGTDEHGAKVAKSAEEKGKSPQKFVDEISRKVRALKEILNLSNDDFIRTTDQKKHWPAVKKVWLKLKEKGDIYKKKYKGLYCAGCEAFITKKDLKNGECVIHQKKPDLIEEENYFFRLSQYSKQIERAIEKDKIKIIPKARKNEILSFIKQGLEDVSFSRPQKDLKWGIPVPNDNTQTVYVWADALTNYLSAIDYFKESKKFKKYWPADIHCIGKDILRFHAAIWPGMLLSLGLPLPKTIFVHGFITVDGQKMSKSLGNVIDPFELVKKYGTDAVRYFFLREIPSTEDGDFTYEKFEKKYNADLADDLGNLANRVLAMIKKYNLESKIKKSKPNFNLTKKHLEKFEIFEALEVIWQKIKEANKLIDREKPWELAKKDKEKLEKVLQKLYSVLEIISFNLQPFIPESSKKLNKALTNFKPINLFPKIE